MSLAPRMERYLEPAVNRAQKPITFCANVETEKLLVMLCDARGQGQLLLPMERTLGTSRWLLTRPLSAGSYRYRYYAQRGELMVYLSPADANDPNCLIDGTEGIITVDPAEPAADGKGPTRGSDARSSGALGSEFTA